MNVAPTVNTPKMTRDDEHPAAGRVTRFQSKLNRSTRSHWDWFASHRRQIEGLLLPPGLASRPGGRLCVLGAGNCNDLHLTTLADAFAEVHLVDLDTGAIADAARRQGVDGRTAIQLHGGVDLTGIADTLSRWPAHRPDGAAIDAALRALAEAPLPDLGGPFDVVLSPCLLSQLIRAVALALGGGHDAGDTHLRFPELLVALRRRHLRTMAHLLAPAGRGLLACDLVSTETMPEVRTADELQLQGLMDKALRDRNFFTGLSPSAIRSALQSDGELSGCVERVQVTRPWRWHLGPKRAYLVYAVHFRRREERSSGTLIIP